MEFAYELVNKNTIVLSLVNNFLSLVCKKMSNYVNILEHELHRFII